MSIHKLAYAFGAFSLERRPNVVSKDTYDMLYVFT
jgi:hypothetical protein